MEKRRIKMGIDDKKRYISEVQDRDHKFSKDFPGKVIPAGNGANVIVTSLDKIIHSGLFILEPVVALLK